MSFLGVVGQVEDGRDQVGVRHPYRPAVVLRHQQFGRGQAQILGQLLQLTQLPLAAAVELAVGLRRAQAQHFFDQADLLRLRQAALFQVRADIGVDDFRGWLVLCHLHIFGVGRLSGRSGPQLAVGVGGGLLSLFIIGGGERKADAFRAGVGMSTLWFMF
ncbi:hypothetical protein JOS77_21635 [Chromobacterium haemolyticum]|nr:hypothetical protein JOS77_21635 [Chromobacterium haemolyticum]